MSMSSSSLPVTPERVPSTPYARSSVRRSFTVPPKLATPLRKPEIGAAEDIETLCVVPKAKVVSFSTAVNGSPRPHSSSGAVQNATPGNLPWQNTTERTMAAGPLEIYRVPGSVSFLHSGKLLHAILPRSQCWCVDGVSIFAFRVLPEQYYRIELPSETDVDKEYIEELKTTLQKVLQYEKTACPFKRGFTVDLPETPEQLTRRPTRVSTEPVKRWKLDRIWRPEDWIPEEPQDTNTPRLRQGSLHTTEIVDISGPPSPSPNPVLKGEEELPTPPWKEEKMPDDSPPPLSITRPRALSNHRSVTAPCTLDLQHLPVDERLPTIDLDGSLHGTVDANKADTIVSKLATIGLNTDEVSNKASEDLLNNVPSDSATTSKSPVELDEFKQAGDQAEPDLDLSAFTDGIELHHLSEDDTVEQRIMSRAASPSSTKDLKDGSWTGVVLPPETVRLACPQKATPEQVRHETARPSTKSTRRSSSYTPNDKRPSGLVYKTYTILTSPPSYLVNIMLEMAGKIANGALHLGISSPAGVHRHVPGSWSDDEDDWNHDGHQTSTSTKEQVLKRK